MDYRVCPAYSPRLTMQAGARTTRKGAVQRRERTRAAAPLTPSQAAKTLMVLGLLKSGRRHGYELHRIIVAHGTLYSDFKKPTLYHLLHRLALQGAVHVRSEGGARGPRGERLVFALTPKGEALLLELLRDALSSYDAAQASFEVATAFLGFLPAAEARELLRKRREAVCARRVIVLDELQLMAQRPDSAPVAARQLATDHARTLIDAEMTWMDRAIRNLAVSGLRRSGTGAANVILPRAVAQ
jgi:DNA-binding PadR family transcriptional regulator